MASAANSIGPMKLAEAILERVEISKRVNDLLQLLRDNAVVQDGDKPLESPTQLLTDLVTCYGRLEEFNRRINLTNNSTPFGPAEDGKPLKICDALALREILDKEIRELSSVAGAFKVNTSRYSNTEIKSVVTMDPKVIRTMVDTLKNKRKDIDRKIQEINWKVELLN